MILLSFAATLFIYVSYSAANKHLEREEIDRIFGGSQGNATRPPGDADDQGYGAMVSLLHFHTASWQQLK